MNLFGELRAQMLLCVSMAVCILWFVRYFVAMAPKRGTLEWIAATDRGHFSPTAEPPAQGWWLGFVGVLLLGAATYPARMQTLSVDSWPQIVISAMAAVAFYSLLICLTGKLGVSVCGVFLLLAVEAPSLVLLLLLCSLLLFFLFLTEEKPPHRVLLALLSFLTLSLAGIQEKEYWLLCLGYLFSDVVFGVLSLTPERKRPGLWLTLEFLWLCLLVAAGTVGIRVLQAVQLGRPAADWLTLPWALPVILLPRWEQLPALAVCTAVIVALVQAIRRHDSRCLLSGLLGVSCLPLCLFGAVEAACAGGVLALCATFAGGWARGAKWSVIITTTLLTMSILLAG